MTAALPLLPPEAFTSHFSLGTSPLSGRAAFAPVQTGYKPLVVFSAKLRKLGLREEIIGYGPSMAKWEEWNRDRQEN
jgi:hypothetical protein